MTPKEKEGMATCSSILAWKIQRTEEPGRLQFMGSKESDMTEQLNTPKEEISKIHIVWRKVTTPLQVQSIVQ